MNEQDGILLETGTYWRALKAFPEQAIELGMVLLLSSIRDVDQQAHTIIMRPHPSVYGKSVKVLSENGKSWSWKELDEHRFLVQDFLKYFVPAEDAAQVRQQEVAKIQNRIALLQGNLSDAQANPAPFMGKYLSDGIENWEKEQKVEVGSTASIPMPTSSESLLVTGLSSDQVEQAKLAIKRKAQTAIISANWIKEKVEEISDTVKALTPFFTEQAAAALARTEDIRLKVDRIYKGIESLDLYILKNVDVVTLRTGKSADPEIPLAIKQSKLYMDEEFSVWADVSESFDFRSAEEFLKALGDPNNQGLVDQIFPTERCVICMATSRRDVNCDDPWTKTAIEEKNKEVFLLVRDGENIHQVWSPVESHLRAGKLFPSKHEIDSIYREKLSYWDKQEGKVAKEIDYMNVEYTDKLNEHDAVALHYKRFLILLAGLDHKMDLFGMFYTEPKSFNFIGYEFMNRHMEFIHDGEYNELQLTGDIHPSFDVYFAENNKFLRSGSRVMCDWSEVMTSKTAPGAVKYQSGYNGGHSSDYVAYSPKEAHSVVVVFKDGDSLRVKVPVSGYSYSTHGEREFDANVNISLYHASKGDYGFMVLDAVKAKDLHYYIHNRQERQDFLAYIRLFKEAERFLENEEARMAPVRATLLKALADGEVATGERAEEIVDKAVMAWRAANRGAELPDSGSDAYKQLLDQMFELSQEDTLLANAVAVAEKRGLKPLRLTVSGKSTLRLYCAPKPEERDDSLFPYVWVHALTLYRTKSGLGVTEDKWKTLPPQMPNETTVHEWPEAAKWIGKSMPKGVKSYEHKQEMMATADDFGKNPNRVLFLKNTWTKEEFETLLMEYTDDFKAFNRGAKQVVTVQFSVPVGVAHLEPTGKGSNPKVVYISIVADNAAYCLYAKAPDAEGRKKVMDVYTGMYRNKEYARERMLENYKKYCPDLVYMSEVECTEYSLVGDGPEGSYLVKAEGDVDETLAEIKKAIEKHNSWSDYSKWNATLYISPMLKDFLREAKGEATDH